MRICEDLLRHLGEKYEQEVKPVQHPFIRYVEIHVENNEKMSSNVELIPIIPRGEKSVDKKKRLEHY